MIIILKIRQQLQENLQMSLKNQHRMNHYPMNINAALESRQEDSIGALVATPGKVHVAALIVVHAGTIKIVQNGALNIAHDKALNLDTRVNNTTSVVALNVAPVAALVVTSEVLIVIFDMAVLKENTSVHLCRGVRADTVLHGEVPAANAQDHQGGPTLPASLQNRNQGTTSCILLLKLQPSVLWRIIKVTLDNLIQVASLVAFLGIHIHKVSNMLVIVRQVMNMECNQRTRFL